MPTWQWRRDGGPARATAVVRPWRCRGVPRPYRGQRTLPSGKAAAGILGSRSMSSLSQLARRSDRLIDFGDQPAFDLGRLFGADRKNTTALDEFLEIRLDGQAGHVGGEGLQRQHILVSKAGHFE